MSLPTDRLRYIWQTAFNDSEEFVDLYFRRRYPRARTFVSMHDGQVVAQAQCIVYNMTSSPDQPMLKIGYVSGLATLPAFRGQGHATYIMRQIHRWLYNHHAAYCLLIPQDTNAALWYSRHFSYQAGTSSYSYLATSKQINTCTPVATLTPHLTKLIQQHLKVSPYTVQHTARDLADQMAVCKMSGSGLYSTPSASLFMAEKLSLLQGQEKYRILDIFTTSIPALPFEPEPYELHYMYLTICNSNPLPSNLRITLMLD